MPHPQNSLNETSDFAPISDFALNVHVIMSDGGVNAMWMQLYYIYNFTPNIFFFTNSWSFMIMYKLV